MSNLSALQLEKLSEQELQKLISQSKKQIKKYIENASETEQYLIASGSSEEIHTRAQELLCEAQIDEAWNLLLARSISE